MAVGGCKSDQRGLLIDKIAATSKNCLLVEGVALRSAGELIRKRVGYTLPSVHRLGGGDSVGLSGFDVVLFWLYCRVQI